MSRESSGTTDGLKIDPDLRQRSHIGRTFDQQMDLGIPHSGGVYQESTHGCELHPLRIRSTIPVLLCPATKDKIRMRPPTSRTASASDKSSAT
jgi:hypothetical protein